MWKIFRMAGALVLPWLLSLSADAAPLSGALRVADQYRSAIKLKSHRGELGIDRTSTYPANFMQWNRGGDCFRVSGRPDSKLVQVSADDHEVFSASTVRFAPLKRAEGEQMSTYNTLLAYSDAWDDEEEDGYGFYRFDPFSAVANRLRTRDELNVNGGGTYIGNDEYFCTIYEVADGYVYIDHFIFNTLMSMARIWLPSPVTLPTTQIPVCATVQLGTTWVPATPFRQSIRISAPPMLSTAVSPSHSLPLPLMPMAICGALAHRRVNSTVLISQPAP
jgi:hypothetical protein